MKNKLLIITMLLSMFLITGCGSQKMTCTKETTDSDNYKTTEKMEITYDSEKVLKVKSTNISETDPSYVELQLSFGKLFIEKFNELDGIKSSIEKVGDNKVQMMMEVEYAKISLDKIKDVLGDSYSEDDGIYTKKTYTIDEFKKENLDGYTCK